MANTAVRHCLALLLLTVACAGDTATEPAPDLELRDGFEAAVFATDFDRPTQMILAPNGDLIIAELNGSENDENGRVLRVNLDDPTERTVLQDGLDKPTGIAIVEDRLWIMERRRLSVTELEPQANRSTVADDLPYNGRSEGTLMMAGDRLYYNTSGSTSGADRVPGSGTIFAIENAGASDFSEPIVIAEGFKHAYATLVTNDGQLWSVEMTDGNFDGERASDELLALTAGDDAGWPQCVDDNRVVVEYGGSAELCASAPPSHALFGPGATPTSFVLAPWDADVFVVALWLPGQVVTVPRTEPTNGPHEPTVLIEGIESPQHLLVDGERLLISDHETGTIFEIKAPKD